MNNGISKNSALPGAKVRLFAAVFALGAFGFFGGGCADGDVGVSAYPDYSPYYGYYGYDGEPYYGYGGIYDRVIVVDGRRYSGGYGRQHFEGGGGEFRGGGGRGFGGGSRGGGGGRR